MANDDLWDTNAEQVSEWIEDEREDLEDEVEQMIDDVVERTHEAALEEVPVDTGRLRDSLQMGEQSVYSELDYAPHVGLGTIYMEGTDYLWGPGEEVLKRALEELASD